MVKLLGGEGAEVWLPFLRAILLGCPLDFPLDFPLGFPLAQAIAHPAHKCESSGHGHSSPTIHQRFYQRQLDQRRWIVAKQSIQAGVQVLSLFTIERVELDDVSYALLIDMFQEVFQGLHGGFAGEGNVSAEGQKQGAAHSWGNGDPEFRADLRSFSAFAAV